MSAFVTNLDLYCALKSGGAGFKNTINLYNILVERIGIELSSEDISIIKSFCHNFTSNISKRWSASSRTQKTFLNQNSHWLESEIVWPKCKNIDLNNVFNVSTDEDVSIIGTEEVDVYQSSSSIHKKLFKDLSDRQKKRRSLTLLDHSEEELVHALCAKLKLSNKTKLATIIKELFQNEEKCEIVDKLLFTNNTEKLCLPDDKTKYFCASILSKASGNKKTCYPPKEDITVTESGVKIRLQSLLDLTINRILKVIQLDSATTKSLKLISKWGFDGSSSHSNYKQKSQSDIKMDDSSVFMISLVPLRLVEDSGSILWENPTPSSTNYCRPIGFKFSKETNDLIQEENASINEEICNLVPTIVENLEIHHDLYMTMIDGKISTVVSNTSSAAVCNICGTPPSKMNDLDFVSKQPIRNDMYKYGLSSLHMWIRCMECILHISYNLDFKKWAARSDDKLLKDSKKK
ncbi:unnamed protein product [Euphydryas editha]|uniref:Uncharacterized protein n=1 Tax=Euphydryas editha TaxID=104508 RepID=A0AAU9TT45_EUPED|nr:unnamed protein product [Euphydryas editha]